MLSCFVRAWNNKGKSFDIRYDAGTGIYFTLQESAKQKIQLEEFFRKRFPTLNEMYLSFMDPAGEIINFQFIDVNKFGLEVLHQMYFKQESEKRELVFENSHFIIPTELEDIDSSDFSGLSKAFAESIWKNHCIITDGPDEPIKGHKRLLWENHGITTDDEDIEMSSDWHMGYMKEPKKQIILRPEDKPQKYSYDRNGNQIKGRSEFFTDFDFGIRRKTEEWGPNRWKKLSQKYADSCKKFQE